MSIDTSEFKILLLNWASSTIGTPMRYGEIIDHINTYTACAVAEALKPKTHDGHCSECDRCVCGGDLPRVREGCVCWIKAAP